MRKLIMWNVVTLDGHFEGTNKWEIDWHETVWGPDLEAFSADQLRRTSACSTVSPGPTMPTGNRKCAFSPRLRLSRPPLHL